MADTMDSPVNTPGGAPGTKELAERIFADLRALSADGPGVSRQSYGPGESEALDHLARICEAEGLSVSRDRAANLVVDLPGTEPDLPVVLCGSHLDSVPQGGNFDGAAGVLAAIMAVIRMKRSRQAPRRTVRAIGLRGEESAWYDKCYLGSSALLGALSPADLKRRHRVTGQSLGEAMRAVGAEVDRIEAGERLIDPKSVAAFLELHIEQGPVMVARDLPVAIVTGIRGNIRHRAVTCRGEPGHSGAVPRWLRRDAVFATAEFLSRVDEHWSVLLERGLDLVVTAGIIHTNPDQHAMSRIPGEVTFSFEVRSQSRDTLEAFHHLVKTECNSIAANRKVRFEFDEPVFSAPATMDRQLVETLLAVCGRLGLPRETIPSGAGHDAAVFANAGVPTAMIFVRNAHGSHNPKEAMDLDDFMAGADVVYHALKELAS